MRDYRELTKELRDKLILTQQEFAKLLGVSFASVNRWENGKFEPSIKVKRKIVELCKENNINVNQVCFKRFMVYIKFKGEFHKNEFSYTN